MNVSGKTAIITGGTAGIGYAIAEILAKNGANIIVTYLHDEKRAGEVVQKLGAYGIKVIALKANSGKKEDLENVFSQIINFENIDILVNNVGSVAGENEGKDEWEVAFHHIIMGTVNACKLFEGLSKNPQRVIINISSVAGTDPLSWYRVVRNEAYCSLKSAINTLTKIRANAYNGAIRVCAIAPGNTLTEGWNGKDPKIVEARMKGTLIHRFVTPEEIAKTALHIIDNDALNGEIIKVDGGIVAKGYEE